MRTGARAVLLTIVATGLSACPAAPVSFRIVDLEEAQRLVRAHEVVLVEVPEIVPGAAKAIAPSYTPGSGVLVFGVDERSTRAHAAAVARAGNHPVLVFVPRDADERGRFYAVASPAEEDQRGKDS